MKNNIKTIMAALLVSGIVTINASAASSAQQTVTYQVSAINELSVDIPTVSLTVNSATPGAGLNVATDSTTTYAVTTNEVGRKITGSINSNMPAGVVLSIYLNPGDSTYQGKKTLSTSAVDLVTGITKTHEAELPIAYELAATEAAGVVASATKTVTLTLTAGS